MPRNCSIKFALVFFSVSFILIDSKFLLSFIVIQIIPSFIHCHPNHIHLFIHNLSIITWKCIKKVVEVEALKKYEQKWVECWQLFNELSKDSLSILLSCLARIPYSSDIKPPSIDACHAAVSLFLGKVKNAPDEERLRSFSMSLEYFSCLFSCKFNFQVKIQLKTQEKNTLSVWSFLRNQLKKLPSLIVEKTK